MRGGVVDVCQASTGPMNHCFMGCMPHGAWGVWLMGTLIHRTRRMPGPRDHGCRAIRGWGSNVYG